MGDVASAMDGFVAVYRQILWRVEFVTTPALAPIRIAARGGSAHPDVNQRVIRLIRAYHQIVVGVVCRIAVRVVDARSGRQRAPKRLFRNQYVAEIVFTGNPYDGIAAPALRAKPLFAPPLDHG
jgi:hypothetical protein